MKLLPGLTAPTGGGAVRGIGEKFSANPATGTASLAIPIATPPGRGGFDLGLRVSYDSGSGNGPFGVGMHISVPAISRKTERGLPQYIDDGDEADMFVLSGAEDLVPLVASGEPTATANGRTFQVTTYRPRVEAEFARIQRWRDVANGDTHWRATTRDNVTSIYGADDESRIHDPANRTRVFTWLLARTEDDRGNVVTYSYAREDSAQLDLAHVALASRVRVAQSPSGTTATFIAIAQQYLKRIRYGTSPHIPGGFAFEVVLDYGDHSGAAPTPTPDKAWDVRPDPFSTYKAGFEIRTYRRCARVLVFHHFPELGPDPYLVRSTELIYAADESQYLSTLIQAVQKAHMLGPSGPIVEALPPLDLRYSAVELHQRVERLDADTLIGAESGLDPRTDLWIDFEGEGLPGLLRTGAGGWYYKRNLGDLRFAPPAVVQSMPGLTDLTTPGVQLQDLGGDSHLDLVSYQRGHEGYYAREADGSFAPFRPFRTLPVLDWNDPNLRMVDLDGDGLADILITEDDVFVWYPSLGKDGFGPAHRTPKALAEDAGPALVFADGTESILLADLSGDGLVDLVRVRHGHICYWPNLGHGRFGAKVIMTGAPGPDTPTTFDPRRVRFADVDGSGPADFFYIQGDGSVVLARNQSGNGWASATTIATLPPANALGGIDIVDLRGNGASCLVWVDRGGGSSTIAFVDLLAGVKPHLLQTITNNMGGRTELSYLPSTTYCLRDRAAGRPWLTRLPFPVHCLARVVHRDLVNEHRVTTEYRYHHGHFDTHEREFAGFACVEQLDAETLAGAPPARTPTSIYADSSLVDGGTLDLPPARVVTWFHTGAFFEGDALEAALRAEYYAPTGTTWLLPDTALPTGLTGTEAREAARALRGRPLRQEVYADDGSPRASVPYAVTEHAYAVAKAAVQTRKHPVFHIHETETIRMHLEREADDPRIEHDFVLRVDEFGNVLESVHCAYPRAKPAADAQVQGVGYVAVTEQVVHHTPGPGPYRLGVPLSSRIAELHGLALGADRPLTAVQLVTALATARAALPIPYEHASKSGQLGTLGLRLVQAERHGYWTDDFTALSWTQAGTRALRAESHTLALTPGLIQEVYGTSIAPDVFDHAGYVADAEGQWAPSGRIFYDPACYYLPHRAIDPFDNDPYEVDYDQHGLLVTESRDPLVNRTRIVLDPAAATTPAPLADAESPYRTLQPTAMLDPNDNGVAIAYDAFGRVIALANAGKGEGDTLSAPSAQFVYRPDASPPYSYARVRERHADPTSPWQERYVYVDGLGREAMTKVRAEPGLAQPRDGDALARNDYGNLATPTWTEPRWVGTGRIVYDNKGNPVRRYEPYFSTTHAYETEPELVETGVSPLLRYDPLGRLVETLRPDGALARVVFDTWTRTTWDENDTVLTEQVDGPPRDVRWLRDHERPSASRDDRRAAALARRHAGTPTVVHLDALGRPVVEIADAGVVRHADGSSSYEYHRTETVLDIEGQPLAVIDARGVTVLTQKIDLGGRTLQSVSPDAGTRTSLWDATGQLAVAWDARGVRARHEFDVLRRPIRIWAKGPDDDDERLRVVTVYGESRPNAQADNLRTRPWRVYDGAGSFTTRYTFKGQPAETVRRLPTLADRAPEWTSLANAALTDPKRADATLIDAALADADTLLEAERFTTKLGYDALDRVVREDAPDGSITTRSYNEASFLETVTTTPRGGAAVRVLGGAEYNARGQRIAADVGGPSGELLRVEHDFDPLTFRLTRIIAWKPTGSERTQRVRGAPLRRPTDAERYLQDLLFALDPVGNIVAIRDSAMLPIIRGHNIVSGDCVYDYDAVYRLIEATGREHPGQVPHYKEPFAGKIPHQNDAQGLRRYVESYTYDEGGNIRSMSHGGAVQWSLDYEYEGDDGTRPRSNRLEWTGAGDRSADTATGRYEHDPNGNMTRMPGLDELIWSWDDRLEKVITADGAVAYYQYDAAGQRVRKRVVYTASSKVVEHLYVGNIERRRTTIAGVTATLERLHVRDDQAAIALFERRDGGAAEVYFQLNDHLGSGRVEVDVLGEVSTYEEYTPWGRAAFQVTRGRERRLRYNGKERDEETGLHYYGARYYAVWMGRWTASDPAMSENRQTQTTPPQDHSDNGTGGEATTQSFQPLIPPTLPSNAYLYCKNAPTCYTDPDGYAPVGWIYVVEAGVEGFEVAYVGQALEYTSRLDSQHHMWYLINQPGTKVTIYEVTAQLNPIASSRNSLASAVKNALSAAEQTTMDRLKELGSSLLQRRRELKEGKAQRYMADQSVSLQPIGTFTVRAAKGAMDTIKNIIKDESGTLNVTRVGELTGAGAETAKRLLLKLPQLLTRYIGLSGAVEQAAKTERFWTARGIPRSIAFLYGAGAGVLGALAAPVDLLWLGEMGAMGADNIIATQYKRYGSGPAQQLVGWSMRSFNHED